MKWIQALKLWNGQRSSWCIPRKGTPEYDEVRTIMSEGGAEGLAPPRTERFDRPAGPRRRRAVPVPVSPAGSVGQAEVEPPELDLPERAMVPAGRRRLPTPGGPRPVPAGAAVARSAEGVRAFLRSVGDDAWKYYATTPEQAFRLYEAVNGRPPKEKEKAVIAYKIMNPMAPQSQVSEATGVREGDINRFLGDGVRRTGAQYTVRGKKGISVVAPWMIPLPPDV